MKKTMKEYILKKEQTIIIIDTQNQPTSVYSINNRIMYFKGE